MRKLDVDSVASLVRLFSLLEQQPALG
jgi:hypothetical protein